MAIAPPHLAATSPTGMFAHYGVSSPTAFKHLFYTTRLPPPAEHARHSHPPTPPQPPHEPTWQWLQRPNYLYVGQLLYGLPNGLGWQCTRTPRGVAQYWGAFAHGQPEGLGEYINERGNKTNGYFWRGEGRGPGTPLCGDLAGIFATRLGGLCNSTALQECWSMAVAACEATTLARAVCVLRACFATVPLEAGGCLCGHHEAARPRQPRRALSLWCDGVEPLLMLTTVMRRVCMTYCFVACCVKHEYTMHKKTRNMVSLRISKLCALCMKQRVQPWWHWQGRVPHQHARCGVERPLSPPQPSRDTSRKRLHGGSFYRGMVCSKGLICYILYVVVTQARRDVKQSLSAHGLSDMVSQMPSPGPLPPPRPPTPTLDAMCVAAAQAAVTGARRGQGKRLMT